MTILLTLPPSLPCGLRSRTSLSHLTQYRVSNQEMFAEDNEDSRRSIRPSSHLTTSSPEPGAATEVTLRADCRAPRPKDRPEKPVRNVQRDITSNSQKAAQMANKYTKSCLCSLIIQEAQINVLALDIHHIDKK